MYLGVGWGIVNGSKYLWKLLELFWEKLPICKGLHEIRMTKTLEKMIDFFNFKLVRKVTDSVGKGPPV